MLEGGYEPHALAECVHTTLVELDGDEPPVSAVPRGPLTARAAAQIGRYWPL